jgi:hypothetical protein
MHGERLPGRQFFKSPTFARQASELDAWESVDELKSRLALDPTLGDVIKGTSTACAVRCATTSTCRPERRSPWDASPRS